VSPRRPDRSPIVDAGRGLVIGRPRSPAPETLSGALVQTTNGGSTYAVVLSSPSTVSWVGFSDPSRAYALLAAVSSNRVTRASPGAPWRSRANPVRLRDEPQLSIGSCPEARPTTHWPVPLAAAWMAKGARGPYLAVSVRHHRRAQLLQYVDDARKRSVHARLRKDVDHRVVAALSIGVGGMIGAGISQSSGLSLMFRDRHFTFIRDQWVRSRLGGLRLRGAR